MKTTEPTGAELAKGWVCPTKGCLKHHPFDVYVYAHWDVQLKHTCGNCGAVSTVQRGVVRVSKRGKAPTVNPAALNGTPGNGA